MSDFCFLFLSVGNGARRGKKLKTFSYDSICATLAPSEIELDARDVVQNKLSCTSEPPEFSESFRSPCCHGAFNTARTFERWSSRPETLGRQAHFEILIIILASKFAQNTQHEKNNAKLLCELEIIWVETSCQSFTADRLCVGALCWSMWRNIFFLSDTKTLAKVYSAQLALHVVVWQRLRGKIWKTSRLLQQWVSRNLKFLMSCKNGQRIYKKAFQRVKISFHLKAENLRWWSWVFSSSSGWWCNLWNSLMKTEARTSCTVQARQRVKNVVKWAANRNVYESQIHNR